MVATIARSPTAPFIRGHAIVTLNAQSIAMGLGANGRWSAPSLVAVVSSNAFLMCCAALNSVVAIAQLLTDRDKICPATMTIALLIAWVIGTNGSRARRRVGLPECKSAPLLWTRIHNSAVERAAGLI